MEPGSDLDSEARIWYGLCMDKCNYCNGFGEIRHEHLIDERTGDIVVEPCRPCQGSGEDLGY